MVALGSSLPGMYTQAKDSITATVSGTNVTSEPLVYGFNRVTTSANNTDGVLLPPADRRATVVVFNDDAAQDIVLFGSTYVDKNGDTVTDTVNGTAGTTGVTAGQQTITWCFCATDGAWHVGVTVPSTGMTFPTS